MLTMREGQVKRLADMDAARRAKFVERFFSVAARNKAHHELVCHTDKSLQQNLCGLASTWQSDLPHEFDEAWIGSELVEMRVDVDLSHPAASMLQIVFE